MIKIEDELAFSKLMMRKLDIHKEIAKLEDEMLKLDKELVLSCQRVEQ